MCDHAELVVDVHDEMQRPVERVGIHRDPASLRVAVVDGRSRAETWTQFVAGTIHVEIAETVQHAGHADVIREAIDGQLTMG